MKKLMGLAVATVALAVVALGGSTTRVEAFGWWGWGGGCCPTQYRATACCPRYYRPARRCGCCW